ncbi:hypothetical protein Poli38472_012982 [Pythium oligandrum]|uniref:Uncharacterized protein n=1 Tax=Pythium oligandrum TaxID=41045 RepID=A0A8K1CJF8_PYTOL|nr:hypothetical protein Poli38472_012982 [Pythium oligandrum]|eukprot:TMW64360.1 hypothetical protein Poli38472_012982 [Pythium oligandrum]
MEGYLIQLPARAWGANSNGAKRRRSSRQQKRCDAKVLYYILGEGYLNGYASPDDMDPVESFQLTSFQVEVDPIYSMLMFRVYARPKSATTPPPPPMLSSRNESRSSSEGDSSDEEEVKAASAQAEDTTRSILLFAGDKMLVESWAHKVLNWNRHVFGDQSDPTPEELAEAKARLVAAFHTQNQSGMFSAPCNLVEERSQSTSVASKVLGGFGAAPKPPVSRSIAANADVAKPSIMPVENRPWWLAMKRNPSRRINAIPILK